MIFNDRELTVLLGKMILATKKKSNFFISTVLAVIMVFFSNRVCSQEIYVSPAGLDQNKGSIEYPVKTIEKALELAIELGDKSRKEIPLRIMLREGDYPILNTINIDSSLSGLHIAAYREERVTLSGGISIPLDSIEELTLASNRYLDKRKVFMVDLGKLGIKDYGKLRNVGFARPYGVAWGEIFVNKQGMRLARWPNKGMIPIGKVIDEGSIPRNNDFSNRGGIIQYDSLRINGWANEKEVWMSGYFRYGYADDRVKVSKIDTLNKRLFTASPTLYGFDHGKAWQNWYGVNIWAELDADKEYYLDRLNGKLYFIWTEDQLTTLEFSMLESPFFSLKGADNVRLTGLNFECARGMGIAMSNTDNVEIRGCVFKNLGSLGIMMGKGIAPFNDYRHEGSGQPVDNTMGSYSQHMYSNTTFNRQSGKNNRIIDCTFYQLGAGGVSMGGGNRLTLEKGNNLIENCVFYDLNRIEKSYRPAIDIRGVGNQVRHCEMYRLPSMAILMGGNDHLFEYNYIHDVCLEVEDQGAFYYGRDPSERGTVLRYNYFENIPDHFSTCAVYNDDGACGLTVESNVFFKAGMYNVLLGGGSDNHYKNNIFIGTKYGLHVDNRLQNWSKGLLDKKGLFEKRLNAVKFDRAPYSTAYPQLNSYWDHPEIPQRNVVANNVFYRVKELVHGQKKWLAFKDSNWETDSDIGFADTDLQNFSLSAKSDVFQKIPDFKAIPFHLIGLYESKFIHTYRNRNGMRVGLNQNNRNHWTRQQEKKRAYQVNDMKVDKILKQIKQNKARVEYPNPHKDARWFGEGNFGLFMHWGPHSTQGAQPSWAMIKHYPYGYEEKYSDPQVYFDLSDQFNPQSWDPDKLCKAAKEAGMSYIVLTAKHHDGFALWPSKYGNYNIGITQNQEDLLEAYVKASKRHGLKVGFYFSQQDWHFPDYPVMDQNYNFRMRNKFPIIDQDINHKRYTEWLKYSLGQLNELLSNYGKIDILWFDGFFWPGKEKEHYTDGLFNWIRSKQPAIVVNDRWYKMRSPDAEIESIGKGDFATVEWKEPESGMNKWWEFTTSWCQSWGYSTLRFDDKEALNKLLLARSMGGNFLLNIGPSGEGLPPDGFYAYMQQLGRMIKPHKSTLFGKGVKAVESVNSNVYMTKKNSHLYLHISPAKTDDRVVLDPDFDVKKMKLLTSGKKVKYYYDDDGLYFSKKENQMTTGNYYVIEVIQNK